MKQFIALAMFLAFFGFASAIIIVPPVVYIATVSIFSVISNMFVGLFFWIAVQGIATKSFFGKPFSAIIAFIIPTAGKLFFALLLIIIFSIIIMPIALFEILFITIAVSIAFFFGVLLSRFRKIRNTKEKSKSLSKIVWATIIIFILSFASIMLSIETRPIVAGAAGPTRGFVDILKIPSMGARSMAKGIAQEAKKPLAANEVEALWLVPTSSEKCTLQAGKTILSFFPQKNCLQSSIGTERAFCPITVLPAQISQKGLVEMKASGSCSGSMTVIVKENSFEVVAK